MRIRKGVVGVTYGLARNKRKSAAKSRRARFKTPEAKKRTEALPTTPEKSGSLQKGQWRERG